MIYRKPSTRPRKLLLRVAAPAGVAAVLGTAAACSSASTSEFSQSGDAAADHVFAGSQAAEGSPCADGCGFLPNPEDASDHDVFVGGGVTGVVAYPEDASDAHPEDVVITGVVVHPDAGDE